MKLTPRISFSNLAWLKLETAGVSAEYNTSSRFGDDYGSGFNLPDISDTLLDTGSFGGHPPAAKLATPMFSVSSSIKLSIPLSAVGNFPGADFLAFTIYSLGFFGLSGTKDLKCEVHTFTNSTGTGTPATSSGTINLNNTSRITKNSFGIDYSSSYNRPYVVETNIPAGTTFIVIVFFDDTWASDYSYINLQLGYLFVGKLYKFAFTDKAPSFTITNTSTALKNNAGFPIFDPKRSKNSVDLKLPILTGEEAALIDEFLFRFGKDALVFLDPFYNYDTFNEFAYRGFYRPTSWGSLKRIPNTTRYSTNIVFTEQVSALPIAPF